jgi:predicted transcriptional regulator
MNPGLDTLYAQTLARSQHLPHFSVIISTIALLFEPLSIAGLAELLGIESFEIVHVLVNLQAIIHIPGTDELPVSFCHTSLRDFLTTESRSKHFFASLYLLLHLIHRCFLVSEEERYFGTAAAAYSIEYSKKHIHQFVRLSSSTQGQLPRFPETVDALYGHVLAESQDLSHFFDILSTVVFLFEPLPIIAIAELLGLEAFAVSQVLANLQEIITQGNDDSPVTWRHKPIREYLITESRSGRFFTSPSYHLHLAYRCFIISDPGTAAASYSIRRGGEHVKEFICLPPNMQGPLPRFPHSLDDLYSHVLAKSQDLPHLLDILSTVVFLFEPLPIIAIAELLGLEASAVSQVLANLQAFITYGSDDSPATWHHQPIRQYLITESRSGRFFTPPSYHLHLAYRCSIIGDPGTAAASYSIRRCGEHTKEFICLPPNMQGPLPRFPHNLDDLYSHVLAKSQDLPYFFDIISTIVHLLKPLPSEGIAELLGIEPFEVSQLLANLRGTIIAIPGNDDSPVRLCDTSARDFLTTKSRSGHFFASPSYHIHLLCRCIILRKGPQTSAAALYSTDHYESHIDEVIRVPRFDQEILLYCPQMLDALYAHLLGKSQDLPHFSDIISTIVFIFKPLPVFGIAELLGVDASEVSRVLVNLQAVININTCEYYTNSFNLTTETHTS